MRFLIIILLFSKVVSQDIGQKMIDNGDYESALNYYQYLLNEENLSKDDIIYNLATIYSSIDSLKKAEEFFDYAMQDSLNPSSELSYNRGNLLYRSKMLDESLKSYREALLKNPEDNDARKNNYGTPACKKCCPEIEYQVCKSKYDDATISATMRSN